MYLNQFLLTTKQDERVRNYVPTKNIAIPNIPFQNCLPATRLRAEG